MYSQVVYYSVVIIRRQNSYFTCVIHILIPWYFASKNSFASPLRKITTYILFFHLCNLPPLLLFIIQNNQYTLNIL